jgi:hypothetical protein
LTPGPTGLSSHNHKLSAQPFTVAITDDAAQIKPGKQQFRGKAIGMRNVAVVCPAGGKWFLTVPADDGSFSVEVDVPDVHGPITVDILAWDSPPNDPNYSVNLKARIDLFVTGTLKSRNNKPPAGHPAAEFKMVWSDEFEGPLSYSSSPHQDALWFAGGKPSASGAQYSNAYFVPATDVRNPFFQKEGFLRIRATHDSSSSSADVGWWSGHLSTGFPDESASIEIREGYVEARMKVPAGAGAWPAFWLLDSKSTLPSADYGAVEIDVVEAYGHDLSWYVGTQHQWPGPGSGKEEYRKTSHTVHVPDISHDFHIYGVQLTRTSVIWYFDHREVYRAPLYRSGVVSPFFLMLNLSIGGGWPIHRPPSGYYDLWVDYVRVYQR